MIPVKTELTNKIFRGKDSEDMPSTVHSYPWVGGVKNTIETCWHLTPEEIKEISRTGKIYLNVVAKNPQPCLITVESLIASQ